MILSVSRRTDIPAFYPEWFMNRLREGFVYVRNPMNVKQVSKIVLSPENVDCIVFWTKDPENISQYMKEIDGLGYKYYFQFTITPYGKEIEENIRNKQDIIDTFKRLSDEIGKEKVILRYDPILITKNKYTIDFHVRAFEKLISALSCYTKRAVISFIDGYRKVAHNMKNIEIEAISREDMNYIGRLFSKIAKQDNIGLETCAEEIDLEEFGINHSKCIDGDLIESIAGYPISHKSIKDGSRLCCGCMKCVDIGQYDSCIHNCLYCYANINKNKALENYKIHNAKSPILFGGFCEENVTVRENGTKSLRKKQIDLNI